MLKILEKLDQAQATELSLTLPFELRQKSRLKASLNTGEEVGLMLPRGLVLRGGECVKAENGSVICIIAADEEVSEVRHADPVQIARASYHLGNRHVALQVGDGWLRYLHDHVLDDMVRGLGLEVSLQHAPFEPEAGAYGGHSHSHKHGQHSHDNHSHEHNH